MINTICDEISPFRLRIYLTVRIKSYIDDNIYIEKVVTEKLRTNCITVIRKLILEILYRQKKDYNLNHFKAITTPNPKQNK